MFIGSIDSSRRDKCWQIITNAAIECFVAFE